MNREQLDALATELYGCEDVAYIAPECLLHILIKNYGPQKADQKRVLCHLYRKEKAFRVIVSDRPDVAAMPPDNYAGSVEQYYRDVVVLMSNVRDREQWQDKLIFHFENLLRSGTDTGAGEKKNATPRIDKSGEDYVDPATGKAEAYYLFKTVCVTEKSYTVYRNGAMKTKRKTTSVFTPTNKLHG